MLKQDRPLVVAHRDAMQRSMEFLKQQPWSTLITIMVIAVTLMLASLCWMASHHVSEFRSSWQNNSHISLYLADTLSDTEQEQLLQNIRETAGVAEASLISAAEGLTLLSQQEGMQDVMHYLPKNPLPAVIVVTPNAELTTPQAIEQLYQSLKELTAVEDAKLDRDWVERLYSVLAFLTQITKCLMTLLALAVMLVIGNTLRLIIYHRHEEIQVLQLLGAPDIFIMRPFLYSGVWYGLLAACLAILLADGFILLLRNGVNQWALQYQMHFVLPLLSFSSIVGVIFIAIALGWLAASVTVRRYL